MFKIINDMTPSYLQELLKSNVGTSVCNLRTLKWNLALPTVNIKQTITGKALGTLGRKFGILNESF